MPLDGQAKAEILSKEPERKEADALMNRLIEDQESGEIMISRLVSIRQSQNQGLSPLFWPSLIGSLLNPPKQDTSS